MKWCTLLLLLMVYNSWAYPTTESSGKYDTENGSTKKNLGSSVVTSVSVVLKGNEPQYTDAVGNTIPKPLVPGQVASPINLLNPDRYEFYTFNDNGDLVKRLMTLSEIQSIVANGNGDGAVIHSFPINDRDPEKNVHDIVESVQKVLNKEVAWKKNITNEHLVLDTPDVSQSWSMILPAIFGNTGTEIFPNKPQQVAMTPDTDVMTKRPGTKVPLIHNAKPDKPIFNKKRPYGGNEVQNANKVNQVLMKPSNSKYEPSSPMPTALPFISSSTTQMPSSTLQVTISSTSRPYTSRPLISSTLSTSRPSSTYSTTTPSTTIIPLTNPFAHPGSTIPPYTSSTSLPTSSENAYSQSQVPMNAVDITYGSEPEFSEYQQQQNLLQTTTGGYGGFEAEDLGNEVSSGYMSPSLNSEMPTKDDENTKISFNQILESLTNEMNTEKIELEMNTKDYTTIEPVMYNGDLFQQDKLNTVAQTTDSYTTNSPDKNSDITTQIPTTQNPSSSAGESTTIKVDSETPDDSKNKIQVPPMKTEDKPLSVIAKIDQFITDQKNLSSAEVDYKPVSFEQSVKFQNLNSGINMDDYVQHAATIASTLEGSSAVKTTTQSNEISEPVESNEINKLIPDVVNQVVNPPQIVFEKPEKNDLSNRVSNLGYLNPDLLLPTNMKPSELEMSKDKIAQEIVISTTIAADAPVTHTRFNLRPTYQSHTKINGEGSASLTTQTEPNSAIEVNTPNFVKINSIKAEAYFTTEPSKLSEYMSTTMVPEKTTMYSDSLMSENTPSNEDFTEEDQDASSDPTTSEPDTSTELISSHETEQAYVKLGESTEKVDPDLLTTFYSTDPTDMPETTMPTTPSTPAPMKDSLPNTLKPVHYYKHPSSATDQKLMQFNSQRPIMRPPALSNLKVTAVGQPPRIPVRLEPTPSQAIGLKSSTIGQDEDVLAFAKLCNELAFNYWKSITAEKISSARSLVVSPFALTSMLSMVFLGARGSTSGEMNEILKLDDMVTFNPHLVFKNITDSVEKIRDSHVTAATFIREIYTDKANGKVLQFFKEKVQQFYSGHVEEVNFNIVSDIIRRRTNLLVKRHTAGKVSEYLRTNSVWVNGPFATFSANLIQTDCSRGSVFDRDGEMFFQVHPLIRQRRLIPIPAVVWRAGFTAGYDSEVDATVVAFGNALDTVSVVYVMPGQQGLATPSDSLERLENTLIETEIGTNAWGRLLACLSDRPGLEVQLPRFSHRSFVNASAGLQRMGLKSIFNSNDADLRGLTGSASRDVYLSDMIQVNTFTNCGEGRIGDQHHIEMYPAPPLRRKHSGISSSQEARSDTKQEEASTIVQDSGRAMYDDLLDPKYLEVPLQLRPRQARIPDAPRLRFDKPFLYFVRHNPTGMILFMGRFNPRLLP